MCVQHRRRLGATDSGYHRVAWEVHLLLLLSRPRCRRRRECTSVCRSAPGIRPISFAFHFRRECSAEGIVNNFLRGAAVMVKDMNLQKRLVIARPGTHADDRQVVRRLPSEHGMELVPISD